MFELFNQKDSLQRQIDGELVTPYGVTFLDEALGGILPGDIVLLGAKTGVGKTQFATQVALNAGTKYRRVHYFALEAEQWEIERRLLHSEMARDFWALPPHRRPFEVGNFRYIDWRLGKYQKNKVLSEIEAACRKKLLSKTQYLEIHYKPQGMTVTEFVEILEGIQLACDLLILDHFHYFDWEDAREYDAIRNAVKRLRTAALKFRVPLLLIAHLRKSDGRLNRTLPDIDDFHGSSDLSKICTAAILIARSKQETITGNAATHFYIAKSRSAGDAVGYVGTVGYNLKTGTYEAPYMLGRNVAGEVEQKAEGFPCWCVNVVSGVGGA
jgi:hypothetical protein